MLWCLNNCKFSWGGGGGGEPRRRCGGGEMKLMSLGREVLPQEEKIFPPSENDLRDLHVLALHE